MSACAGSISVSLWEANLCFFSPSLPFSLVLQHKILKSQKQYTLRGVSPEVHITVFSRDLDFLYDYFLQHVTLVC